MKWAEEKFNSRFFGNKPYKGQIFLEVLIEYGNVIIKGGRFILENQLIVGILKHSLAK